MMGLCVGGLDLTLSSSVVFSSDNPTLRIPPIAHSNLRFAGHRFNFRGKDKNRVTNPSFTCCSAKFDHIDKPESRIVKEKSVSVILLAGGKGKRMGATMPKQYLPLLGQPIALYSLYTFSRMPEVKEIIVVCDPSYKDIFEDTVHKIQMELKFTLPGKERQDSVYSGLQAVDLTSELVCIHDSARPLVSSGDVEKVLKDGWLNGAAVLGVPAKATIKEANSESFVVRTLDRKTLWEMQTPQVIKPTLLKKGFELVNREGLEVTDDVSIVEHLQHPVYITEGSYTNIKVTTPDDLLLAERILNIAMDPRLYRAATSGDVGYLRRIGDDDVVHQRTPKDSNVLHIAAEFKQIEFFRHLSDHARYRPLFWGTNKKGDTPLHVAARVGCDEVVKFLIQHANKDQHIIEESGVPADKQLLRITNLQNDTALHLAARYDCRGVVTLLMEADPELCCFTNNANESPLFIATRKGYVQTALSILNDCPIPPSYEGTNKLTALHAAVTRIRIHRISFPHSSIHDIIFGIASIPDIDYSLVKILVSKNPGIIKVVDAVGWTPLHYAALGGNPEATQILMKGDSSASYILDNFGMSALHVAAFVGRTKVMKEMIRDRPDTCDLLNHKGQTILHAAVFGGQANVVKYILKAPELAGLINDADEDGNTPLHLAVIHKRRIIINILKSNATNNKLEKAIDIVLGDRLEQDNVLPRVFHRMGGGYTGVPYFHEQIQREFMKLESLKNDTSNTQEMKASSSNEGSKTFDTNLLVAILIATVTFTAAFTIPGGFKSDGTPVLQDKVAFQVFLIFDVLSFLISIYSVFINFTTATFFGSHRYAHPSLIQYSIGGMIVAFASSTFVVLPKHSSLGIAISVICGLVLVIIMTLY